MSQQSHESVQHTTTTSEANELSLANEHDVCQRCLSIPWYSLRNEKCQYKTVIDETYQDLQNSDCRICRFLGHFFWMRNLLISSWQPYSYEPRSHILGTGDMISGFEKSSSYFNADPTIFIAGVDSVRDQEIPLWFPETIDFQLIKSWLQTCSDQHGQLCTPASSNLHGLKVIDCERRVVVHAPKSCAYVALSYLWGDAAAQSLDALSLTSQIPATIEDSIQITRELGFKYLWVDRYCVTQEDGREKMLQIEQMGSIYAAAQITLVAALGLNPSHGLPGALSRPRVLESESIGLIRLYALPPHHSVMDISRSPWVHRAWTLQEGFMSRRRLIFTKKQVILVCNRHEFSEVQVWNHHDFSNVSWLPLRMPDYRFEAILNASNCVQKYSGRTLTYETDALLAIVGVLNTFRDYGVYHLWAVPYYYADSKLQLHQDIQGQQSIAHATYEYDDAINLLWSHQRPTYRRRGFPSWSPIGWKGSHSTLRSYDPELHSGYRSPVAMLATSGIKVSTKSGSRALCTFVPDLERSATDAPRQLEIRALTVNLPVIQDVEIPWSFLVDASLEKTVAIQLDLGDSFSLMFVPRWSIHPTALNGVSALKALLIPAPESNFDHPVGCLLMLQSHGVYYERVGIAMLPDSKALPTRKNTDAWMESEDAHFHDINMQRIGRKEPRHDELVLRYLEDPHVLLRRLMELSEVGTVMLG